MAIFCPHVPGNGTTASLEITSLQKLEAIHLLTFEVEYAVEQPTPSPAAPFVIVWDCLLPLALKKLLGCVGVLSWLKKMPRLPYFMLMLSLQMLPLLTTTLQGPTNPCGYCLTLVLFSAFLSLWSILPF